MKRLVGATALLMALSGVAMSAPALLADYAAQAGVVPSAARGQSFFQSSHVGGKPDTPSCTTCHTTDPRQPGRTRAGKVIDPMALSATPTRFSDMAKAEKWFARNCDTVLGRACTAGEKADVVAYLSSL
jgi:hypothetical protein